MKEWQYQMRKQNIIKKIKAKIRDDDLQPGDENQLIRWAEANLIKKPTPQFASGLLYNRQLTTNDEWWAFAYHFPHHRR